jgi:hypothetical protein
LLLLFLFLASLVNKKGKKKRKVSTAAEDTDTDEDQNSDVDEALCEECHCPAPTRRQLKLEKGVDVSWIQCDGCASWYHTVCVAEKAGNDSIWEIDNFAAKWYCDDCPQSH